MDKQWTKVLEKIKDQVSSANYRTWFSQTSVSSIKDGTLTISVPSAFIKQQLTTKYSTFLEDIAMEFFGEKLNIEFFIDSSKITGVEPENDMELKFTIPSANPQNSGLNPKYTMHSFMVGLSNNLAHAAAMAVIQNPGVSYNPLFIYGGTGVGKTHLMHAIGNSLLSHNRRLKIIYCSSERFMNDFIESIQNKRTGDFRAKYRSCDLLLIDDIQFISGRDSTQEEFFHTFNELQTKNSQIILTSDRPPNEIQKLESRLQSRFQGGLMVDIQQPDFDTRVAILKARATEQGENISEDILALIAENVPTNARELEGRLLQIIQSAKLLKQTLNIENVKNILGKNSIPIINQKPDYKKVINEINQYFNIKMADLTGPRRKRELVIPRQITMYLLYEECKIPYERIGELLGGRDHTTIMHGVEKISEAINRDREIQRMTIEIKQNLII